MLVRPRIAFFGIAVIAIAAFAVFALPRLTRRDSPRGGATDPIAALADASGWAAGAAVPVDSLRGRVVLIVAWSDVDPLSLRLLREADAWQQAYGRFGFRVVGVHVPEFAFSADSTVPAQALRRLGVRIPVALDAGSRVGTRLGVGELLPLWIVVGANGRRQLEAEGDRAGAVQRALLDELRRLHPDAGLVSPPAATDVEPVPARRIYCGTSRAAAGPLAGATPGVPQTFTAQFRYQEQGEALTPYPVGRWTPSADGITSARGGASDYVAIRYDGGPVDAVLGAASPARVWVMCDEGWVPEGERGEDVRADARGATFVEIDGPRPYRLVRGVKPHVLRLSPEGPGVTYYAFMIGGS